MESFGNLALLIGVAAVLGLIANRLKQPLILGYIVAGVLIQLSGVFGEHALEGFELFSTIGIVFLLFILGLELNVKEMMSLGLVSLVTGVGQIIFTVIFGLLIATLLGYDFTAGIILATALTFSSTIVIVKLLSIKNDLDSLYGKISVGFLLVQDLVAIIILVLLGAALNSGASVDPLGEIALLILKLGFVLFVLYLISEFFAPLLIRWTGHDREVLFVSIIALALVFSAIVASPIVGLSIEIGALAAGIALAKRKEALQIESWTRPLRDFFITVFFVLLGFQVQLGDIGSVLAPALVFSVFVLVGNPLIVIFLMRLLGFHTKTGLMAGLTVAQISEFSLLVATMALRGGQISETDLTMLTIVGGITMTVSSYMILHGESFYELVSPLLKRFDPQGSNPTSYSRKHVRRRVVIFGFNRMARALHDIIKSKERKFLVIDNDMDRLNEAEALGATIAFGDLNDVDMLEGLKLEEADLIISTVPARHPNLNLLQYIESTKNKVPVIVSAFDDQDAVDYYQAGADYVLSPYLLIGELLNKIVSKDEPVSYLTRNANRDTKFLSERLASVHGNAQSIELGV